MWESKEHADFIITAGAADDPKEFKVHKCVLATTSSVFAAAFKDHTEEYKEGKMYIEEFSPESIEEFLTFIYTGDVPRRDNAMDLFAISAKYDVSQLKSISEIIVLHNINELNAIEVFSLGNLYDSEKLKQAAFEAIKKMFPEKILQDSLMQNPEALKELVEARRDLDRKKQEAEAEYHSKVNKLGL